MTAGLCTRPTDAAIPLIVGRSRRVPDALLISELLYAKHLTFQLLEAQRKKNGRYYRRKEILDYSAIVGRNLSRHLYFNT